MADARQRRAVLHEFLLVEAQRAVGRLDDGKLVFVVVDGKPPREARADARQRIAVAAQQAHAERMKCRHVRGVGVEASRLRAAKRTRSRISPAALLVNVTARTARRRHVPRRNDVRDAVGDDAGFAAARAGQNQQRPFRVLDRFALLGVQPFEKIHATGELSFSFQCIMQPLVEPAMAHAAHVEMHKPSVCKNRRPFFHRSFSLR